MYISICIYVYIYIYRYISNYTKFVKFSKFLNCYIINNIICTAHFFIQREREREIIFIISDYELYIHFFFNVQNIALAFNM